MAEVRLTKRGKLQGYHRRPEGSGVEAYSRRYGGAVMVGLRLFDSPHRCLQLVQLPDGVDEETAVDRLADFLEGQWIRDVVAGKAGTDVAA